jgi:voltage-gated potassium channel
MKRGNEQRQKTGQETSPAELNRDRQEILETLEDWLEMPLLILGFVWLALLVVEFIWGLSSFLETVGNVIWIVFIVDFALKFTLAPRKIEYLKGNWLTVVALAIPALRVFRVFRVARIFRAARIARGLRLVRIVTSLNRGMKALGASMGRRGFGYVLALSLIVMLSGAAGIFAFENQIEGGPQNYGEALWWTAMILTTMGSDYFPKTAEGRILCLLLAVYGFCIFGYVTATLATFFVEQDVAAESAATAAADSAATAAAANADDNLTTTDTAATMENLSREIAELRMEIRYLAENLKMKRG